MERSSTTCSFFTVKILKNSPGMPFGPGALLFLMSRTTLSYSSSVILPVVTADVSLNRRCGLSCRACCMICDMVSWCGGGDC